MIITDKFSLALLPKSKELSSSGLLISVVELTTDEVKTFITTEKVINAIRRSSNAQLISSLLGKHFQSSSRYISITADEPLVYFHLSPAGHRWFVIQLTA